MDPTRIESIVQEYANNKAEADRLTARNAELAEDMLALARFAPGADTGRLEAAGFKVSITKRINEKWDQEKLATARQVFTDDLFFSLFRQKFEPDRKALKTFMHAQNDKNLKAMLLSAVTTSRGKPAVKLERLEQAL